MVKIHQSMLTLFNFGSVIVCSIYNCGVIQLIRIDKVKGY